MKNWLILVLISMNVYGQECDRMWAIPDYAKIQYAGSIGFISLGPGYYFFNKKLETELMFGFTPVESKDDFYTLTWKINYKPFVFNIEKDFSTSGIYFGIYNSKTFGEQYWYWLPNHYPDKYYYFSPGLRTGFYFGTSINKTYSADCKKSAELFFECGSYDLMLYSYWPNRKTIPLSDILKLAFGVKVDL